MRRLRSVGLYGFLLWVVPLAAAMVLYPVKRSWPELFDSAMAVVLAASTVVFLCLYARRRGPFGLREGVLVGAAWLAISLLGDLPMFFGGPLRMSPAEYLGDIGLTYLMIPAITAGAGCLRELRAGTTDAGGNG
jgi:hypothetical protein